MTFGKHRGEDLEDIPTDYVRWLAENCDLREPLLSAVVDELAWRVRRSPPPPPPPPPPRSAAKLDLEKLIQVWHRRLLTKWHPDRGGTHEAALAVNDARELLLAMLAELSRGAR